MYRFHLFTIKLFLLGGCRPPDPLLFLGGFQPPRPPGGGPAAPRAPLHTERLRLSGSPFFLVPRSWYQNLGSGSWYQVACRVPNVACHAVSIPFVSKSSVSCRVINLRVGVSVPCRGHPDSELNSIFQRRRNRHRLHPQQLQRLHLLPPPQSPRHHLHRYRLGLM